MTFYIITTLFHRKKRGKKKGEEAKQNPPPQHLQTSRSALICSEMGFPLKHILCGKPCFSFFFFFWTSGTNRAEQAWCYSSVLNHCHVKITRHHPVFLCVCVCFLLTPSVLNHCLIPSFFFLGGGGGLGKAKQQFFVGLPHGPAGEGLGFEEEQ